MAGTQSGDETDVRRVLGIEGTAWAASAAVYEVDTDEVAIESDPYQPESGGIHPREAAEHMSEAVPSVVETMLDEAGERAAAAGDDPDAAPIDAVAFSRGPGLGPCLRIVGTAARAVAQRFDVPLVGVNHMVAHLEIGRHQSGFDAPVCLNASGANAHVLAYRNGRYRVLGETMDTGVGNALDKFTRHVGWSHPGGPKVEAHAKEGEYVDLPYVVKGMDFSFSGIMSAAKQEYDDGTPAEDVCRGLEETVFAMLTEVSERALSLTGRDELVLGGGVGQNERLQGMLREMCEQRGASLHVPEDRFLRDNAGMIAVLGAKMAAAGDTLAIEDSAIDADFRPDEVAVTWRSGEPEVVRTTASGPAGETAEQQGAEATVTFEDDRVVKRRNPRSYRHPALDERLRTERTRIEARLTSEARRQGVPTPLVWDVDTESSAITFQRVGECDLDDGLTTERVRAVGRHLARIHDAGFVHGDPTTRNVRVAPGDGAAGGDRVFLIDFGLGYHTGHEEDHAMDLHVFAQSLAGTADDADRLQAAAEAAYRRTSERADTVLDRLRAIEGRGRYQ
ncbi:bifunctional N(6)-L-threonylcarbamoyladenine synthase/serine/threonine protein kinase [Halosimplex salinum]|uniref:bifunctional N(6)-L-threonylcarbamoyladenine synthase/serine/threonine protein kinase n=1 Tax=Halosimplex salinum TaxID=1710538 RepID=UPI000F49A696|nr:bifunctional N(6)-L-threonylcarbamoyladenine synthase/serine/threonine protein kinase [Halosimplex salinum]